VTFSGKVQIDIGLPGQDRSLVTLEIVWTHVRMQVAPMAVGDGGVIVVVVTTFTKAIAMVADGTNIGSNGRGLNTGETGHSGELLPRGGFGSLELSVDIVGGGSGEWKGRIGRIWTCEGCTDVLLPEFAEIAELCLPRSYSSCADPSGSGRQLVGCIGFSEVHENVFAYDALPIVVGKEWSTVRSDACNDVGVIKTHETKGRGEAFLVIRLAGVSMSGRIVG